MSKYTPYEQVNKERLQKDIDAIKEKIGKPSKEDFQHLLKLEKWGHGFTLFGYLGVIIIFLLEINSPLNPFLFWSLVSLFGLSLGIGNVSRWANVTHPILHGAYDKVPNVPKRYTSKHFAQGKRRYLDWLDWIRTDAWMYEHNTMHHYHLGEDEDPDNVENNLKWLTTSKIPMFIRYAIIYFFMSAWKFVYYAPNTLKIIENKRRKKENIPLQIKQPWSPFSKLGFKLWSESIIPYILIRFVLIPFLFYPLGIEAVFIALYISLIGEIVANIHSFVVIVPNHSAEDIYRFETPFKTQGEFYLRQIMGSVNYKTGTNPVDFAHGWLNYQIEHHLFPNLPLSQYQKMQPIVKEICKKHNIEYRQESVFKRLRMSIELMVGKTKLLKVDSI